LTESTLDNHKQEIVNYYEECDDAYRDAWGMDQNLQLNLGLWKKGTKNLKEALLNLNEEVAQKAELKAGMKVLDAGCGVGGTAIYFAKHYQVEVTGITLTPHQVEKAKENARKAGVEKLCHFQLMDYMATSFENESFDVITGLESICYAEPKFGFLVEAKRLLKKGGKIVLAENLQGKADLTASEFKCLYTNAFHGCKVNSLDTEEQYLENFEKLNFSNYQCEDYTDLIRPSIKRLRRFYYAAWAYNKWHSVIGKPFSNTKEANTKMCYFLQSSLKRGLWKYGIIKAVK
jgi:cyclopropane fatty-acyl-phospholipid synthase-like methyltransferase